MATLAVAFGKLDESLWIAAGFIAFGGTALALTLSHWILLDQDGISWGSWLRSGSLKWTQLNSARPTMRWTRKVIIAVQLETGGDSQRLDLSTLARRDREHVLEILRKKTKGNW